MHLTNACFSSTLLFHAGVEIDLWSVAAILPELRTAYPVFPGESGVDQVACIAEVLGLPPSEFVERSPRRDRHFDSAGK
jgi:dual specificity tyrosine-phosphorylation-regulated kinase 2/3/4